MWDCGCLSTQPWWRPCSVAWIVVTRREHVSVHSLNPRDELAEVGGAPRLAHAVDRYTRDGLLLRRLLAAACEHVHVYVQLDERLGELADVPGETALDQRWVLPGQDQD